MRRSTNPLWFRRSMNCECVVLEFWSCTAPSTAAPICGAGGMVRRGEYMLSGGDVANTCLVEAHGLIRGSVAKWREQAKDVRQGSTSFTEEVA